MGEATRSENAVGQEEPTRAGTETAEDHAERRDAVAGGARGKHEVKDEVRPRPKNVGFNKFAALVREDEMSDDNKDDVEEPVNEMIVCPEPKRGRVGRCVQ